MSEVQAARSAALLHGGPGHQYRDPGHRGRPVAVTEDPALPSGYPRLCWDPRPLLPKDLSARAGPLCPASKEGRRPEGGRKARVKLAGWAEAGMASPGGLGRARGASGGPSLWGLRGRRAHVRAHVRSRETDGGPAGGREEEVVGAGEQGAREACRSLATGARAGLGPGTEGVSAGRVT